MQRSYLVVGHDQVYVGIEQLGDLALELERLFVEQRFGVVGQKVLEDVAAELKISLLVGPSISDTASRPAGSGSGGTSRSLPRLPARTRTKPERFVDPAIGDRQPGGFSHAQAGLQQAIAGCVVAALHSVGRNRRLGSLTTSERLGNARCRRLNRVKRPA